MLADKAIAVRITGDHDAVGVSDGHDGLWRQTLACYQVSQTDRQKAEEKVVDDFSITKDRNVDAEAERSGR